MEATKVYMYVVRIWDITQFIFQSRSGGASADDSQIITSVLERKKTPFYLDPCREYQIILPPLGKGREMRSYRTHIGEVPRYLPLKHEAISFGSCDQAI